MITSSDIALQVPEKEDISFLVKSANEKGMVTNRQSKRKTAILEQQRKVNELHKRIDYNLFIICSSSGRHGVSEVMDIDWVHRTCIINMYFEDRAEKVPVYGEKALHALLSYIFNTLGLNKVSVNVQLDDVVMSSLYKSFGFVQELRKRSHYFSNGQYKTILELSMLSEEFRKSDDI